LPEETKMVKEIYLVKKELGGYLFAEGRKTIKPREDGVNIELKPYHDLGRREEINEDYPMLVLTLQEKMRDGKIDIKRNSLLHLVNFSDIEVLAMRALFEGTRIQVFPEKD